VSWARPAVNFSTATVLEKKNCLNRQSGKPKGSMHLGIIHQIYAVDRRGVEARKNPAAAKSGDDCERTQKYTDTLKIRLHGLRCIPSLAVSTAFSSYKMQLPQVLVYLMRVMCDGRTSCCSSTSHDLRDLINEQPASPPPLVFPQGREKGHSSFLEAFTR
jgi:hypothetical protein